MISIRLRFTVERYPFKLWLAYRLLKAARALNVDIEARWPYAVWREDNASSLSDATYAERMARLNRDNPQKDPFVQELVSRGW